MKQGFSKGLYPIPGTICVGLLVWHRHLIPGSWAKAMLVRSNALGGIRISALVGACSGMWPATKCVGPWLFPVRKQRMVKPAIAWCGAPGES